MTRYRYDRRGLLAVVPSAWGMEFDAAEATAPVVQSSIAVVSIRGPMTHHSDWFGDSYDAIKARVDQACATPAETVALDIDSPGGDVAGCFECGREIGRKVAASGKRLVAYAKGMVTSGAFVLACAAESLHVSAETLVGSIGVISATLDCSEADKQMGIKVHLITSGARKADGNPHEPLSDEARAAIQANVDAFAGIFWAVVAERREMSADQVRAFEAVMLVGQQAVDAGLADGVATWSEFLALVASSGEAGAVPTETKEVAVDYEEMVKALRALAEGDDEEKAKKAKAALAALGEEEAPKSVPGEKKESKAEGDEPPADEKKKEEERKKKEEDDKASAKSSSSSTPLAPASDPAALAMAAENTLLFQRVEQLEKGNMLAARPDISSTVAAWLMQQPAATVASYLAAHPKPAATRNDKPTQGKPGLVELEGREKEELEKAMGLTPASAMVPGKDEYGRFRMPMETPSAVRARVAAARKAG
jgi:signal peptide peptidase SppA